MEYPVLIDKGTSELSALHTECLYKMESVYMYICICKYRQKIGEVRIAKEVSLLNSGMLNKGTDRTDPGYVEVLVVLEYFSRAGMDFEVTKYSKGTSPRTKMVSVDNLPL